MRAPDNKLLFALAASALVVLGCSGGSTIMLSQDGPTGVHPDNGGDGTAQGAMLSLSLEVPPTVSVGQTFTVAVKVKNVGNQVAKSVSPQTPVQTGAGLAAVQSLPTPAVADLWPGDEHRFEFTYQATDPGAISFEAGADAEDGTGDKAVISTAAQGMLLVQGLPILNVDGVNAPAQVLVGQDLVVTVTVSNGGQASALVTPELSPNGTATADLVSGPTPAQATIASGETATFSWTFHPTAPGSIGFDAQAKGTDANSGVAVESPVFSALPTDVDTPAQLDTLLNIPTLLSAGQTFKATLVVHNSGTSPARAVLPEPSLPEVTTMSGSASASPSGVASPLDVPGGGTVTFSWDLVASGTGQLQLQVGLKGQDGTSGGEISMPMAQSDTAQVMPAAALMVSGFEIPSVIDRGQTFQVSMTVANNGGATARNVMPNPNPVTITATGAAAAKATNSPAPKDIPAGQSATFTWTMLENGTGTGSLVLTAGARGYNGSTGTAIDANPTQTNLAAVVSPPALVVDSVTVQPRISRGQGFDVSVVVRNSGGSAADNVIAQATVTATGGAAASADPAPAGQSLAAGTKKTLLLHYTENGTAPGTLLFKALAKGVDPATTQALTTPQVSSAAATVEEAAALTVSSFTISPSKINRGQTFALSMVISNSGQASAVAVLAAPNPPTAVLTGGTQVTTPSKPAAITVLGGQSQTLTWFYTESGTADGSVQFKADLGGTDANSNAALSVKGLASNVATSSVLLGCNGSQVYYGFGGRSLDGDRYDQLVGTDRFRLKPYDMLVTDYNRVLGTTPTAIQNEGQTFNAAPNRWFIEQQLSATSLYQAFTAAFGGCLTYTSTGTQFGSNPTSSTATTQCAAFAEKFWNRAPTSAESTACVNFAVSSANNDTNARRRWAYVCASVLSAAGFLAH